MRTLAPVARQHLRSIGADIHCRRPVAGKRVHLAQPRAIRIDDIDVRRSALDYKSGAAPVCREDGAPFATVYFRKAGEGCELVIAERAHDRSQPRSAPAAAAGGPGRRRGARGRGCRRGRAGAHARRHAGDDIELRHVERGGIALAVAGAHFRLHTHQARAKRRGGGRPHPVACKNPIPGCDIPLGRVIEENRSAVQDSAVAHSIAQGHAVDPHERLIRVDAGADHRRRAAVGQDVGRRDLGVGHRRRQAQAGRIQIQPGELHRLANVVINPVQEARGAVVHRSEEKTVVADDRRRVAAVVGTRNRQLEAAAAVGVVQRADIVQLGAIVAELRDLAVGVGTAIIAQHSPGAAAVGERAQFMGGRAAGILLTEVKDLAAVAADADIRRLPEVVVGERMLRQSAAVAVDEQDARAMVRDVGGEDEAAAIARGAKRAAYGANAIGSDPVQLGYGIAINDLAHLRRVVHTDRIEAGLVSLTVEIEVLWVQEEYLAAVTRQPEAQVAAEGDHRMEIAAVGVDCAHDPVVFLGPHGDQT